MRSRAHALVLAGAGILMGAAALWGSAAALAQASGGGAGETIRIVVDATEAPRRIFHANLSIPAKPGALALTYPKWIPGEHGPTGPINEVAGLRISAGGKALTWRRDLTDMYTINVDVPPGASSVDVSLDYLSSASTDGFSNTASSTSRLAVIDWHLMTLYPKGRASDSITMAPTLKLPSGWKFGTSLLPKGEKDGVVEFAPVTLTTLVDSPVNCGVYSRSVDLTSGENPDHRIEIFADSPAVLALTDARVEAHKRLISEALALFGARHYERYHFLLTLSDHIANFGLEHHQSSDDRAPERSLIDEDLYRSYAGLLPHEYVHSWNGKFRRPADLATPNFDTPMRTDLLWVYEGLTEYLGQVLTARSGLLAPEEYREQLALTAATLDQKSGREWRSLQDTADAAQELYNSAKSWANWRRGTDFYQECELIWLEADVLIRSKTQGKKSMDDFCRLFHGAEGMPQPSGAMPTVATYTFDDVVATLNRVCENDWKGFLTERLTKTGTAKAPMNGIVNGGWKLVFSDAPNAFIKSKDAKEKGIDLSFSLGIVLGENGEVVDVVPGMAAHQAGMGPGMKIAAINGRKFSKDIVSDMVKASKDAKGPMELLVENADYFTTFKVEYRGGERFPHLERDTGKADVLGEIIKPLTPGAKTEKAMGAATGR